MDKIIACSTIRREIEALNPEMEAEYLEYGLHRAPEKLNKKVQEAVNQSEKAGFQRIRLGYGLCSNGVAGISSQKATLIVPRMHDCISILLGSSQSYHHEFCKNPGTIYLSRGWIEFGGDPLSQFENYKERVGADFAQETIELEYKNYTRLVFINTWVDGLEEYREYARRAADFINLEFEVKEGNPELLKMLLAGKENDEIAVFKPGRIILRTDLV
ncbi:MAG: DUF1638 domain-containing protein [Bacillota bacterium]